MRVMLLQKLVKILALDDSFHNHWSSTTSLVSSLQVIYGPCLHTLACSPSATLWYGHPLRCVPSAEIFKQDCQPEILPQMTGGDRCNISDCGVIVPTSEGGI